MLTSKFDIQKVFEVKSLNKKLSFGDQQNFNSSDSVIRMNQRESVGEISGRLLSKLHSPTNNSLFLLDKKTKNSKGKSYKELIPALKSGLVQIRTERSAFRSKFTSPKHNPFHKKSGSFSGTINDLSISTKRETPKSTRTQALPVGPIRLDKSFFESNKAKLQIQMTKRTAPSKSPMSKYKEMMNSVYGLTNSQQDAIESNCNDQKNKLSRTFDHKCEKTSSQSAYTDPLINFSEPQALTSSSIDETHLNTQSKARKEVSFSRALDRLFISSNNKCNR